jgi:hypothetical protein
LKFLFGIALAFGIAAAAYGAAATLSVSGGFIQQGEDTNLQCDTDGVTTHYTTNGNLTVQKVWVDNLSSSCAGGELDVILKDAGGSQIWFGSADIPTTFTGGTLQAGTAVSTPALGGTSTITLVAVEQVVVAVYDVYP